MLALLTSHGVSLADLCSTFNQTLTFICVCLLKFFFFLESLEMYYAVLGFFGFIFPLYLRNYLYGVHVSCIAFVD